MKKILLLSVILWLTNWQTIFSQPCEGSALYFDGGNWVEVADHPSLSPCPTCPFTVELWVNRQDAFFLQHILGKRTGCTDPSDYYVLVFDPNLAFGNATLGAVGTSINLPLDEWHHLAAVFDGAQFLFYYDGVVSAIGLGTIGAGAGAPLIIGGAGTCFSEYFRGKIDNVRIWNVARTAQQIQDGMFGSVTGSEPGLAGAYDFDEGSGNVAHDISPYQNDGLLWNHPDWVSCEPSWCGEENVSPVISCPANVSEAECGMTNPNITGFPIASDNCTVSPMLSWSDVMVEDMCPGIGTGILRTWVATDEVGNTAACVQEIGVRCQAHQISFVEILSNSMTLKWINGNGDHRMVVINTVNDITPPENGQDYSADPEYNPPGQQVIYSGTSDHVTVTNLTPNTEYFFKVFEAYCEGPYSIYYLPDATENPKSEYTLPYSDLADNIPLTILSPIKCVGTPGLYQSVLPNDLFRAPLNGFNCVQKKCNEIVWRSNGTDWKSHLNYPQMTSPCEVLPMAFNCFGIETVDTSTMRDPLSLEFRQRGYLSGKRTNYICETPCFCFKCNGIDPCTPGHVSHGSMGCHSRDDRRAWDIQYIPGWHEMNLPVYAVEDGVVDYLDGAQDINIRIRHGGAKPWYSWCVYARPHADLHIGDSVRKGELVGIVFDPDGKDPQLHFGVYYYDADLERFVSEDRPILRNPPGRSLNIDPSPYTDLEIKVFGDLAPGSKLSRKMDSIWVEMGWTNSSGRLHATLVPGLQDGDSLALMAGDHAIKFQYHDGFNANNNINIHLFEKPGNAKVSGVGFEPLFRKTYYDDDSISLKIAGTNIDRFDILRFNESDEEFGYTVLSSDHSPSDTMVNIPLNKEGENLIGVRFIGLDTVIMYRRFLYYGDTNLFRVKVLPGLEFLGSAVYINGQFHEYVNSVNQFYEFPPGGYWIDFTKPGYIDATYYVEANDTIYPNLTPAAISTYVKGDSVVYDFGKYRSLTDQNVSVVDDAGGSRIGVDQYDDALTAYGVIPASRVVAFNKIHWPIGNSLCAGIVLDQREQFSEQQVYLLDVFNGTSAEKRFFTNSGDMLTYDSAAQRIIYKGMNFRNGEVANERIVLALKQPAAILFDDLGVIAEHVTGVVSLHEVIGDPDSLVNDLTFELITNNSLAVWISGDSLFFTSSDCFTGKGSFILQVTHDEIITSDTIWVEIESQPRPSIEVVGNTIFCEGDSVTFIASTGANYMWNTDQTTQSIQVYESGAYYVIVADEEGCVDTSAVVHVEVLDNPEPELEPSGDLQLCAGDTLMLAVAGEYVSYAWSNGSIERYVFIYKQGHYNVAVVDSHGCRGQSDDVSIEIITLPQVDLGPDTIVTGVSFVIDAGNVGSTFIWNTGDIAQTLHVSASGIYSVTVTDAYGCQGVDSIIVQIITGTSVVDGGDRFVLYPNPNTGTFSISGNTSGVQFFRLEVCTVQGTMVYKEDFRDISGSFNREVTLSNEAKGVYIVRLSSGLRSYILRMVVK